MIISRRDDWTVDLKLRQCTVIADGKITIGDIIIDGPGEYDVAGVAVQGIAGQKQTIYVMEADDLRFCIVPKTPEKINQEVAETIGGVDVAIVPVVTGDTVAETIALVNTLDPNVVIPVGDGDIAEFGKLSNETLDSQDNIKLTKASLPLEGRQTYLLKS